jgi:hypothetical protein
MSARVPGHGHLRASDADRERVIDILKTAFVQGRLTKDELGARTSLALTSRTYGELAAATADLPVRPRAAQLAPVLVQPAPRRVQTYKPNRVDKRTVAWGVCMFLLPATLGAAFLTYYVGFLVLFVVAFIGVTMTAQP